MVSQYLKYLGISGQTIQMLPKDILDAATIYDMIQQAYLDIPASDYERKASFAKAIAEGTRNLLIRINALVTTSPQIQQSVQQRIQQLPPQVKPKVVPPPMPPTHRPIVSQSAPSAPKPTEPEKPKPEKPPKKLNTYGLKVGDALTVKAMNLWIKNGLNYCQQKKGIWVSSAAVFVGDRTILGFAEFDGVVGFLVSGTFGVYLRAEGFKEFVENLEQEKPKPSANKPTTKKTNRKEPTEKEKNLINKLKNVQF